MRAIRPITDEAHFLRQKVPEDQLKQFDFLIALAKKRSHRRGWTKSSRIKTLYKV